MKLKLGEEQIAKLLGDPAIQATVAKNKAEAEANAQAKRDSELVLLGYNMALGDYHVWPDNHTAQSWGKVVEDQKLKLGV